jgi:hypothetical protein
MRLAGITTMIVLCFVSIMEDPPARNKLLWHRLRWPGSTRVVVFGQGGAPVSRTPDFGWLQPFSAAIDAFLESRLLAADGLARREERFSAAGGIVTFRNRMTQPHY